MPADILIVDEVLAVGDLAFQRKCFRYLAELRNERGTTLLCVSHSDWIIKETCTRGALMIAGQVAGEGELGPLLDRYHAIPVPTRKSEDDETDRPGVNCRLEDVEVTRDVWLHEPFTVTGTVWSASTVEKPVFSVVVANKDRQLVFASYSDKEGVALQPGKSYSVSVTVPDLPLLPGPAFVEVAAFDRSVPIIEARQEFPIEVRSRTPVGVAWEYGLVHATTKWDIADA